MSILSEVSETVSNILPPKGEPRLRGSSVYLTEEMWERLEEISAESKAEDPEGKGYSRNEVILQFLRWAVREYEAERRAVKRKPSKD